MKTTPKMSTKTMRLPPRRVSTPTARRKEREGTDSVTVSASLHKPSTAPSTALPPPAPPSLPPLPLPVALSPPPPPPPPPMPAPARPAPSQSGLIRPCEPAFSNQLLAGYLAHEYLTKGTLFGQSYDPTGRTDAAAPEPKRVKPNPQADGATADEAEPNNRQHYQKYVELSGLLKTDGAHLPGIFNPTHLSRLLQM